MLAMARAFLERKEIEEARLEAELLVAFALSLDRMGLFLALDRPVDDGEIDRARDLLVRRGRREPVAYITGGREFYGRPFKVDPSVLIPRPETELLVDLAREHAQGMTEGDEPLRIADLGTGSGCLAVTLALEISSAAVWGVDLSTEALRIAAHNADLNGARVEWIEGDGLAALDALVQAAGRGFDLLVSNPPYVTSEEQAELAPEVREYEPRLALFAPPDDPDHWVRGIVQRAERLIAPGGAAFIELGARQGPRVLELARGAGLDAALSADLAGVQRVLVLRR